MAANAALAESAVPDAEEMTGFTAGKTVLNFANQMPMPPKPLLILFNY